MTDYSNLIPRPVSFQDYICDPIVKERIIDHIKAARIKGTLPPHMLFSGPPGSGKTTIAEIIAKTLKVPLIKFVGIELRKPEQLQVLYNVDEFGAVLYIDEIHSISKPMMEMLYPIMEDFVMPGPSNKAVKVYLNRIMVIGSTTEPGSLEKPLLDRFLVKVQIPYYTQEQMEQIAERMAAKMSLIPWSKEAIKAVAQVSKSTPRIAGGYIYQISDTALANESKEVTEEDVYNTLKKLGVTRDGLDKTDRKILQLLKEYNVLGIKSLAAMTGLDVNWIENVNEPYLIRKGLLIRTVKGRSLTSKGKSIL